MQAYGLMEAALSNRFLRFQEGMRESLMKKHIKVVAAILIHDKRILATQRGYGNYAGSWEFPGGKVEPGENSCEALKREIKEELDAQIKIDSFFITVDHEYPEFTMTMDCYLCEPESKITLLEHSDARWLSRDELESVDWLAADEDIIKKIKSENVI